MALAETAELAVKLTLGGNFLRQMGQVNKSLKGFDKNSSRAYKAGQQIGTGIKRGLAIAAGGVALLASQVALGLDSLIELERHEAQTEAVLKSTGQAAGVTAQKVGELSEKYEAMNATVGDEFVREAQNMILTFTNIRGKAFEPTLAAILDMNTAMGNGPEGLTKTAIQVGKALNDPATGLTALRRVGVTFTKEQTKRIKGLQEEGKLYEAQALIIAELDKEFSGSFLAQGGTTAGKVAKFTDSIEDLQRKLAETLLPTVGNIADALTDLLSDKAIIKGAEDLGREIGKLFSKENIKAGAKVIGDVFTGLKNAAPAIKAALGTVGTVLKTAFDAFRSLPEPIQQLLIGGAVANKLTDGLVTNIAGGIFGALKAMTVQAGVVNVTGGIVNGAGGIPAGAAGAGRGAVLGNLLKVAIVGAVVVEGFSIWAGSVQEWADQNKDLKNQGLTSEEIAAMRYYEASAADQATMAKRMGEIPDIADWRAAIAKLNAKPPGKNASGGPDDRGQAGSRGGTKKLNKDEMLSPGGRGVAGRTKTLDGTTISASVGKTTAAVKELRRKNELLIAGIKNVREEQADTKRTTADKLSNVRMATTAGSASIVSAIYANRPIITTNVSVSATTVQRNSTVIQRYGSTGGSRNTNHAPGTGPLE